MTFGFETSGLAGLPERTRETIWTGLVALASIGFTFAFSCAAPLAAIAAVAGLMMPLRSGLALVAAVWLIHQAIGYLLLGYPLTWDSYTWGAALGISGLLAVPAARIAGHAMFTTPARLAAAFVAAFLVHEVLLYVVGTQLPSGGEAFEWPVIARIGLLNLLAFAGLLGLHKLATGAGLLPRYDDALPARA